MSDLRGKLAVNLDGRHRILSVTASPNAEGQVSVDFWAANQVGLYSICVERLGSVNE